MSDSSAVAAMVGRARELEAIDRALHAAAAGNGGLVLVSGEAGIGKSRLLAECARRARHMGMAVLSSSARRNAAVAVTSFDMENHK